MIFTATAAYPHEHLERATAGLRAALRHQILAAGIRDLQVWNTFIVTGPIESTDRRGRAWYEYRATVDSRRAIDGTATATPPSHTAKASR